MVIDVVVNGDSTTTTQVSEASQIPSPMCSKYVRPNKDDAVRAMVSRFNS